jgi:hypothetical protein
MYADERWGREIRKAGSRESKNKELKKIIERKNNEYMYGADDADDGGNTCAAFRLRSTGCVR